MRICFNVILPTCKRTVIFSTLLLKTRKKNKQKRALKDKKQKKQNNKKKTKKFHPIRFESQAVQPLSETGFNFTLDD